VTTNLLHAAQSNHRPGCDTPLSLDILTRPRRQQRAPESEPAPPPPNNIAKAEERFKALVSKEDLAVIKDNGMIDGVVVKEEAAETSVSPAQLCKGDDNIAKVIDCLDKSEKTRI